LLQHQNNIVGTLKVINNAVQNFDSSNWFEHST